MNEREELRVELRHFKRVVDLARKAGLNDKEIIDVLGLNPKVLGKETRRILRAIQQGDVKPDATDIAIKLYGDKNKYRNAYYHLMKLSDAGYLYIT